MAWEKEKTPEHKDQFHSRKGRAGMANMSEKEQQEEGMNLARKGKEPRREEFTRNASFDVGQGSQAATRDKTVSPGHRRGRRGRGGARQSGRQEFRTPSPTRQRRGWKTMKHMVQEVEKAYNEGTDANIHMLIQELETKAMREDSEPEMEDWGNLIPDPGNTGGRLSLYKQALHVYWVVKQLMEKAMEQVAVEMAEMA